MRNRSMKLVCLCMVVGTIACNLTGASAPTQTPVPLSLPANTATTIAAPLAPASATAIPRAIPPTIAPTVVTATCSNSPQTQLAIGMSARVSPGAANNLRSQPSTASSLVTTIPAGGEMEILGGPVCADGFRWWQVRLQDEQTQGWTVEGSAGNYWLLPAITVPVQFSISAGATSQSVSYGNVSFVFTSLLSNYVLARTVYAAPNDPNVPMFLDTSQRLEFTLNNFDYTATSRPMLLTVYKISDLEGSASGYTSLVDALRTMLAKQTPVALGQGLSAPITVIPVQNAGQAFHTQARYFKFLNGTGVRFVTNYTQNPGPVDNQFLTYLYQGISDDGQYYVSALIPINTRNIGLLPAWQNPADTTSLYAYLAQVAQKIDTFGAKDFTPALDDLDAWITSVQLR